MNVRQRRALTNALVAGVITLVLGVALVAVIGGGGGSKVVVSPSPSPSEPPCIPTWERVPSPDPEDGGSLLFGVSAVAPDVAWAVGGAGDPLQPPSTLTIRWNGSEWDVVPSPNVGAVANRLDAVDALSGDAAWAVGRASNGVGETPIAARWDGASWTLMPIPPAFATGALDGVAAFSTEDVWAVGYTGDPETGLERALALHWDGSAWKRAPVVPAIGGGRSGLLAVAGTASDDVWAVGYQHRRPAILHFDGRAWSRTQADVAGTLVGVVAITPEDAWAVGSTTQHWNGTEWSPVGTVRLDGALSAVSAVGGGDVWAVGSRPVGGEGTTKALVQRWNGARWTIARGSGGAGATLTAVTALPDGTVLGVGYRDARGRRATYAIIGSACR